MADAQNLPQPTPPNISTGSGPQPVQPVGTPPTPPASSPAAAAPMQVPAADAATPPPPSPAAPSTTPPTSVQAMPTAQPQPVSSRLMQNLQSVNPTPFQETSVPPMGGMPDSGQASAGQPSLPTSNVPQENIGFSLTDASAANGGNGGDSSGNGSAPPSSPSSGGGTPKPAKAGGMLDSLLQSRVTLFGGIALLIAALLGGGYYVYSQFLAPAPTPVVNTNPGTGNSNTKSTTLTYWGLWEPEEVMQPLIDAYETQNPGITINYVQQKSDQYRQRVQTAIRDGSGPDIFRYHNTWMPMVKSDLSPAPAAVFGPEELEQNFYPIMSRDLVSNNAVYGVPLMYEGLVLLYNQNMLESAGAQPPQDWNQVRSLASQLTIRNGERIERAGIALGTAGNVDHFSDIVGLMLLQNGANPGDPTSDNVVDAMEYYSVYSREDKVWDDTFPNSVAAFSNEQVAMIFAPSWRIFEIQQANPNINIGVVRTPQLGGTTVTWGTYWVEGVSASSKNKQEAWKFLAYLAREEQLREFHDAGSAYRAFGELYPRVEMAENLTTNPLIRPYLEDALYAQSWYLASQTHDEGLNDQMIQYYTDAVNAMNSTSGNVEKALEQIAPGVQQVLSRYSIAVPSAPAAQ